MMRTHALDCMLLTMRASCTQTMCYLVEAGNDVLHALVDFRSSCRMALAHATGQPDPLFGAGSH